MPTEVGVNLCGRTPAVEWTAGMLVRSCMVTSDHAPWTQTTLLL